jgi:methyltransferase
MLEFNPIAIAFLGFLIGERLFELVIAGRNTRRALARGAVEAGAGHYPLILALHVAWLVAICSAGFDRAPSWPMLAIFAALQVFRVWTVVSLGEHWTTRIIVDDAPLVVSGPFRWFRHPNYMVVVGEIFVAPMVLGLWQIAVVFSILNALMLAIRIGTEDRALAHKRAGKLDKADA